LQRVLLNLIKNAADYMPKGGLITVSTDLTADRRVRVSVRDTGHGVDPAVEPYLFTPYGTACAKKYRQIGIGLGLYLSRQIVETHGGTIGYHKISDQGGHGSLFYFELPPAEPEAPSSGTPVVMSARSAVISPPMKKTSDE
jgi:signal transduction histidine kinase